MMEPPRVTYVPRPQIGDMVPVCTRDGVFLESVGLGEYGDGLYCPECVWWWPGLDYWPSDFQCRACEGTPGRHMPYDLLVSFMRDGIDEGSAQYAFDVWKGLVS